jgi:hypothetical protein
MNILSVVLPGPPKQKRISELENWLNEIGGWLQGICGDVDDFLDEVGVTLLVFGYFCEDVFNLLVFYIGRADNLDIEGLHGQLEVSHHSELADNFLFILVSYLCHSA